MNPQNRKYNALDSLKTPRRFYTVDSTGGYFDDDPDETGPLTIDIAVTPHRTEFGELHQAMAAAADRARQDT